MIGRSGTVLALTPKRRFTAWSPVATRICGALRKDPHCTWDRSNRDMAAWSFLQF